MTELTYELLESRGYEYSHDEGDYCVMQKWRYVGNSKTLIDTKRCINPEYEQRMNEIVPDDYGPNS